MNQHDRGSKIAKNGFRNEDEIVEKFNNWREDKNAQEWLKIMSYKLKEIEYVKAIKLSGYKSDMQVQITIKLIEAIDVENIQIKLVSNLNGFNQIDKRRVDKYKAMWNIPDNIVYILKRYTGEENPNISNPRDSRRMFIDEFTSDEQEALLKWIRDNQTLIVADLLIGRGKFSPKWMMVAHRVDNNARWILISIIHCLNFFGNGEVIITQNGNIRIGKITMQRKGGDAGRDTAKMLQFKINPAKLFDEYK